MMTREAAEALAARLVEEMIRRWRLGERPRTEEFLARHPDLWEHPAAAADLIYEEFSLHEEYGPEVSVEHVLLRFPQWRPQLEVLFDCQQLLGPQRAAPQFPAAGEFLGDFLLRAELGSGAHGRVFLASQHSLGNRPVVLKLTPFEAGTVGDTPEHLSLARLQHTHIVPVYSVQDYPARRLRALCMPYFGGASLAQLLQAMTAQPAARRMGQMLLDALDRIQTAVPLPARAAAGDGRAREGPARQALARISYVQAVCWIGACLADALQYAHERGLVHLDLKPSNVLLASDGQPMLLDFHLARGPIDPGAAEPPWLGGTAGYMSPEQQLALETVQQGRKPPLPVDGRSDIFSLGVVLYETLAGAAPGTALLPQSPERKTGEELRRCNAQVSIGLADVIEKCLACDPGQRYLNMATLATDLRRHLAHRPLAGVRNRSLPERWRKWRRRRPYGVALAGMMLAVVLAAGAVTIGAANHFTQQLHQSRTALTEGQTQIAQRQWEAAIATLQHGLSVARDSPLQRDLVGELERELQRAEEQRDVMHRAAAAHELHELADQVRFLYETDAASAASLRGLEAACRALWEKRVQIVDRLSPDGRTKLEPGVRDDLLDLAIFWADFQVRLAPLGKQAEQRLAALAVLAEAETLLGPSPVLDAERHIHGAPAPAAVTTPVTAWEHYALGRSLLRARQLERAAAEVERAVRLQPQGLWPNFYQGLCAYRLTRYADAVTAYSVCIGAAPKPAGCFHNRALAFEALGRPEQALQDYDQALRLDPTLAAAALNRGMLHYRAQRYAAALTDLKRAEELGADPALVSFDLALVHLACGDQAAALDDLDKALSHDPHHAEARKLRESLRDR